MPSAQNLSLEPQNIKILKYSQTCLNAHLDHLSTKTTTFCFPWKGFSLKHVLKEPVHKDHLPIKTTFCLPWMVFTVYTSFTVLHSEFNKKFSSDPLLNIIVWNPELGWPASTACLPLTWLVLTEIWRETEKRFHTFLPISHTSRGSLSPLHFVLASVWLGSSHV